MAFLIRSKDGRVRICTASAEAAQQHLIRLRQSGTAVKVTDFNGARLDLAALSETGNPVVAQSDKLLKAA